MKSSGLNSPGKNQWSTIGEHRAKQVPIALGLSLLLVAPLASAQRRPAPVMIIQPSAEPPPPDSNAPPQPTPSPVGTPPPPPSTVETAPPPPPPPSQPSASAVLTIPSVGSPLSIYTQQPNGTWTRACLTPCQLRVPVGNVTIATRDDGRDAVTVNVPAEGRSYQPELTAQPSATLVNASGLSSAQSLAEIGIAPRTPQQPTGPGFSTGTYVAGTGLALVFLSIGVGFAVVFVAPFTRAWQAPVAMGTSIGVGFVGIGLVIAGLAMGIRYGGPGPRQPLAMVTPTLTPTVQGLNFSVQF